MTTRPVLEIEPLDAFTRWPVAALPPFRLLPLHGGLTDLELGAVAASVLSCNSWEDDDPREFPAEDGLAIPGGLRVADHGSGTTVDPGCCSGLEDWQAWYEVAEGEAIWLGHDPTPELRFVGDSVRLRQDSASPWLDLPRAGLPELLRGVRRELDGFLSAASRWAVRAGCPGLVEAVGRGLAPVG
ncbi:hypothetical protein [Kitasatospora sp. NPDC088346]|uniref:hypothetical protein n=1 Tax=Kitasatospora sp. NPDC088346 TaxID=3364073 RepID=UPI0038259DEF